MAVQLNVTLEKLYNRKEELCKYMRALALSTNGVLFFVFTQNVRGSKLTGDIGRRHEC